MASIQHLAYKHSPGPGDWGYCVPGCPAADDPSGGACQVRTTGQGFPAHCSAQLAAAHKNILFLGNSYTTTNNLPGVLASLAAAAGGTEMEGRRH